jgi:hypothetical protein
MHTTNYDPEFYDTAFSGSVRGDLEGYRKANHVAPFGGTWRLTGTHGRPDGSQVLCSETTS